MIYTAPYIMFLMRADPLQGQVGGGWALEIETFWALWNGIEPLGVFHLGPKKVSKCLKMLRGSWRRCGCSLSRGPRRDWQPCPRLSQRERPRGSDTPAVSFSATYKERAKNKKVVNQCMLDKFIATEFFFAGKEILARKRELEYEGRQIKQC